MKAHIKKVDPLPWESAGIIPDVCNKKVSIIKLHYTLGSITLLCNENKILQITDRRFGRTHLAIYGPVWAQKKRG